MVVWLFTNQSGPTQSSHTRALGAWTCSETGLLASQKCRRTSQTKKNGPECLGGSILGVSFAVWTLYGTIMTTRIDLATQIGRTVSSAAPLYATVANYGAQAPKSSAQVIAGSILGVSFAVKNLYGTIMTTRIDLATQTGRTVSPAAPLYSTIANYDLNVHVAL